MEAILSSEGFNPNESLWAKDRSSSDKEFLVEKKEPGELYFEGKPLSSLIERLSAADEKPVEEAVLIDVGSVEDEAQLEEPSEPMVTLTESEYSANLAQVRAETESRLREELDAKSLVELNLLKERQEDFFRAVMESMAGDTLAADIAALSVKIGAFLARTQLRLDENVVSLFIQSSIKSNELNEPDFVSVRLSDSWQAYRDAVNSSLPHGLGLIFDEALQPGDVVVSAGQGGYFDLLLDRVKMIEDQLSSLERPDSEEWLTRSLRQFVSEDSSDDQDDLDQLKEHADLASIDELDKNTQEGEISSERTVVSASQGDEKEDSVEDIDDNGLKNVDNESDQ